MHTSVSDNVFFNRHQWFLRKDLITSKKSNYGRPRSVVKSDTSVVVHLLLQDINNCDTVQFHNPARTAVVRFLGLLNFYLEASLVMFQGDYFRSTAELRIRACLAPVLGDFLLASCDRKRAPSLPCNHSTWIFCYVDDFLFIFEWYTSSKPQKQAQWTLRLLESTLTGSTLTAQHSSDDNLRFLDLMLTVPPKRMRCKYSACLSKNLLLLKSLIVKSPWRWLPIQLTGYRILPKSIRSASNYDLLN